MKQWIEEVHFCSISPDNQFSLPSPPILSASVSLFPLCLFGALFFRTRTLSPSACSVLNAMWPPFHLCIYDIPKTLNTVGFCLSWWRGVDLSGSTSASFTSFLYDFGQVIVQLSGPTYCFKIYRSEIFARAEHCFIQIKWKHTCLGPDPSLSRGSILWLLAKA